MELQLKEKDEKQKKKDFRSVLTNLFCVVFCYFIGPLLIGMCLIVAGCEIANGINIDKQLSPIENTLETIADTLITTACNEGHTDLDPLVQQLQNESDMDFTVDWSGTEYIAGTKKVNIGREICLKLFTTTNIEGETYTIDTARYKDSNIDYSFEYLEKPCN